ncbi:hypothetical protein PAXRUDRAFT_834259 [Paxillus rubicundulus Ve08.2h10]|uniref:Unplaced genomic scaffold scaffold_1553, whole genome shotgun sequence n=1 Tax=Paxillus rubicundulus Ve08.2h10 TaxID=930991 RepID=A0A0D0DLB4_9AGAM|nr:hypothetical protein PAXRUDRAFT_834259 [Paxillus rubicundulus Ve08.2h10]
MKTCGIATSSEVRKPCPRGKEYGGHMIASLLCVNGFRGHMTVIDMSYVQGEAA